MRTISIDIESYSSVDLSKSGVYKYAKAPDFEIILLAYSVDGGEVQVVELASGETIPPDIIDALTDDTFEKGAFNAAFERICLSKWLGLPAGQYLKPESWRCSMVWSAYMGLPLSLENAPDKWALFKLCNRRDVETELSIQARLAKFPVPDNIWEEYRQDQPINERGVLIDMTLVKNAIAADERSRNKLLAKMRELTDIENPNSVAQTKA